MNRTLGCALLSVIIAGCGASDDTEKPNCGTVDAPMAIELKDISPAAGASVPNSGIVETFTIVGRHLQLTTPTFALPPAHTAGQPVPATTEWSFALSGADTVYTSQPLSWEHAPAHVEMDSYGLLETSDHCISALPKKIFEYDVTAP